MDLFRPRPGRKREGFLVLNSASGVGSPSAASEVVLLLLLGLLILKKFLSLVGRWLLGVSVPCFDLDEKERLEKFRRSVVAITAGCQINGSARLWDRIS